MAAWVGGGFDEEFEEGEVWGKERDGGDESKKKVSSGSSSSAWHLPAAPRKIPRANTQSSHESGHHVVQGSSAPLDIPDWSKIYQKNGKKKKESKIYGEEEDNSGGGGGEDDDDDDDDGMMIPPHEWIARKLARSQISSFSVCEGVGRTLKGRDLSKVRNAILTKTGFIE